MFILFQAQSPYTSYLVLSDEPTQGFEVRPVRIENLVDIRLVTSLLYEGLNLLEDLGDDHLQEDERGIWKFFAKRPQAIFVFHEQMRDFHKDLALEAANLLLDHKLVKKVEQADVSQRELGLSILGLRVVLSRYALALQDAALIERLERVDEIYQQTGRHLIASLDVSGALQYVLLCTTPAGKDSGWSLLEEPEDVFPASGWWGWHDKALHW